MHNKRIDATVDAIDKLLPKYCLPHSADFVLNGPVASIFLKHVNTNFMDRDKVSKTYGDRIKNKITQSLYLDSGDVMVVQKGEISIKRNVFDWLKVEPRSFLNKLNTEVIPDLQIVIKDSFDKMLQRAVHFGVDVDSAKDWVLVVKTETIDSLFCFREKKYSNCQSVDLAGRKILKVILTDKQLSALIMRELHWNNATIGCHLRFTRTPNEFCHPIYKMLNFLHI
jgi:hypothetical protein